MEKTKSDKKGPEYSKNVGADTIYLMCSVVNNCEIYFTSHFVFIEEQMIELLNEN